MNPTGGVADEFKHHVEQSEVLTCRSIKLCRSTELRISADQLESSLGNWPRLARAIEAAPGDCEYPGFRPHKMVGSAQRAVIEDGKDTVGKSDRTCSCIRDGNSRADVDDKFTTLLSYDIRIIDAVELGVSQKQTRGAPFFLIQIQPQLLVNDMPSYPLCDDADPPAPRKGRLGRSTGLWSCM